MNNPQRPMPRSNPKVPVVRRTAQSAKPESLIPQIEPSSPRAPVASRPRPMVQADPESSLGAAVSQPRVAAVSQPRVPVAKPAANPLRAYVALSDDLALERVEPHKTAFFDSIAKVQAVTLIEQNPRVMSRLSAPEGSMKRALADQRGYEPEDLFAVAEIGYHYLMNGGVKLAVTLFEGLTAVAPNEPYFALALGLALDHQGDKQDAMRWYDKAANLDPFCPRADLNRAELLVEARDFRAAQVLLERAVAKAKRKNDDALTRKASAILAHVSQAA